MSLPYILSTRAARTLYLFENTLRASTDPGIHVKCAILFEAGDLGTALRPLVGPGRSPGGGPGGETP